MINNSAADCSIRLYFLQSSITSRSRCANVVWSSNYCSSFESRVSESTGDVRILTRSSKIAVCAHAQYTWPKTAQNDRRDVEGLQVAMHSQLPRFLVNCSFFLHFYPTCLYIVWTLLVCFLSSWWITLSLSSYDIKLMPVVSVICLVK